MGRSQNLDRLNFGHKRHKKPTFEKAYQYASQNGKCHYCQRRMCVNHQTHRRQHATWDHVKPVCQGGTNHHSNLVLACPRCNNAKGGNVQ